MLYKSMSLIKKFNSNKIHWLVWKGCYHYIDGFCGNGDIDILVMERDMENAKSILVDLAFVHYKTQSFLARDFVEDWIALDELTGTLIHVHLYQKIVYGHPYVEEYCFLPMQLCFEKAVITKESIYIQNPAIEYFLFICRLNYEHITKKKAELSWRYFQERLSVESLKVELNTILKDNEIDELFKCLQSREFAVPKLKLVAKKYTLKEIHNAKIIGICKLLIARIAARVS